MQTNDKAVQQDISWEDIQKYIQKDIYKEFLKQIPQSVFKMALSRKDRPKVIKIILKVLHERDAQNASETYAEIIAKRMQTVAQKMLKDRQ